MASTEVSSSCKRLSPSSPSPVVMHLINGAGKEGVKLSNMRLLSMSRNNDKHWRDSGVGGVDSLLIN